MTNGRNQVFPVPCANPTASLLKVRSRGKFWHIGWLFPRNEAVEKVETSVRIPANPETVWRQMLMYEDVPARPPLLLRLLLPNPVRTQGGKTRVGSSVQCTYDSGHLAKRITAVEPPHRLEFDVIEQRIGIEGCITTLGGSYRIQARGADSEIILTTNYLGHLRPRRLWRPFERFLAHQLHTHILDGMRASLLRSNSSTHSKIAEASVPTGTPVQDPACTTSPLSSPR
ncbi:MAG: SRPBCC family protein [Candidatus Acidiferrales bacterium]